MKDLWELFVQTGLPEAYMLYKESLHGGEDDGDSATRHRGGGE